MLEISYMSDKVRKLGLFGREVPTISNRKRKVNHMERRIGLRGRTDFAVTTRDGYFSKRVRGVELSGTGIVLDQGRETSTENSPVYLELVINLPERHRPIRAWARPVWSFGSQQAFRFIKISDVDRLTLAEHLDVVHHRGDLLN